MQEEINEPRNMLEQNLKRIRKTQNNEYAKAEKKQKTRVEKKIDKKLQTQIKYVKLMN